ncbi:LOW QUALITY PROTEIN: hypothetical protein PHMEG_00037804 [Phytophthora megakarya]|uniref:RNase H type-1 domain-containing protein n=1 Tax=Phytophthora megakarya TaxID=4795 RepID=A0A225UJ01_9STRA|nr:LOW QUALITY PROTEIN: hypothetical protein PHMEG_00037804 [Phytophthora megakarya]
MRGSFNRYHIAEKEVLAILRQFRPLIYGSETLIVIYTRYSVLKWLLRSNSADGRHLKWGLELSKWTLELPRRDEEGLAAILGAGITPREHLDEVAENLIPAKGRIKAPPPTSVEMLDSDFEGYVLSFDGAAKISTRQGSCGCILSRLPGWHVLSAHGFPLEDVTVNDAEYHRFGLAVDRGFRDVVVVGDSRIVIQQAQGLIGCHQPNLQRRLAEYEALKVKFGSVRLVHVKRNYNQAADYLTLALGKAWVVEVADELMHLKSVSRIPEKIMKTPETSGRKDGASQSRKSDRPSGLVSDPVSNASETVTPVKIEVVPDKLSK